MVFPRLTKGVLTNQCVCTGTILDDLGGKKCIPRDSCPCMFQGKVYMSGGTYSTPCQNWYCCGLDCTNQAKDSMSECWWIAFRSFLHTPLHLLYILIMQNLGLNFHNIGKLRASPQPHIVATPSLGTASETWAQGFRLQTPGWLVWRHCPLKWGRES